MQQHSTERPAYVQMVDKSLSELAKEIKVGIAEAAALMRRGMEKFREVGDKLIIAKKKIKHGDFDEWLEKEGISKTKASRCRSLARYWVRLQERGHDLRVMSLNECLEIIKVIKAEEKEKKRKEAATTSINSTGNGSVDGSKGDDSSAEVVVNNPAPKKASTAAKAKEKPPTAKAVLLSVLRELESGHVDVADLAKRLRQFIER